MSKRSDIELLRDILESIEKIRNYTAGATFEDFERNDLTADAVARNLTIIGEVAGRLSDELTKANAEIPWRDITGLRHKIVHDYFSLDYEIIWKLLDEDLPVLRRQIESILDQLS